MGAGKFVSSSTFRVGGYDWNIRMYPDGWKEEDKPAHLSVFLCFCGGATGVRVKYNLSLLDRTGQESNLASNITNTFVRLGGYWGHGKFIEKSKLQELLSRNDDCFTIRCVLTVIKEARTEDRTIVVPIPESNLHTHFARMLKDGEGVDVTFSVGDQLFSADKNVLAARSSVFKTELYGQMKENSMKCVRIDDMDPAVFEALLHFIYTDSLPSNSELDQNAPLQHLLVAADRYGLDRLKAICEGKLCQIIDVQTVATTVALAEQHHCVQLKSACVGYLSSQEVLRDVSETDGFKHLAASCP
jgi:speckle-type POZ protein